MAYKTIHTAYGLQRMAAAEATGVSINLTHMAVGDGGGNPVEPSESQASLVREQYRREINRVYNNPTNPRQYIAEMIIPKEDGGFTLREFAVFDDTGSMFLVGNLPEAYLPADGENSFSDVVVRCVFEVSNASVVTLQVDPNVAVASQSWVINTITAAFLLPGGLVNEVLAKASNADGDTVWVPADALKATVTHIEEPQTLADGQTQVDLAITTTNGLAVYIEGVRLRRGPGADEWRENPADPFASLVLGRAYPSGAIIVCVQNDPLGNATEPLARSQDLADVLDKAKARQNLDVFSRAQTRQMAPPGKVSYFAGDTAPAGWLKANGAELSRTAYADLFAYIGTKFGAGDGYNTFLLPDLRGEFIRGWDDGRNIDAARNLGTWQEAAVQSHTHGAETDTAGSHSHGGSVGSGGAHSHQFTYQAEKNTGGNGLGGQGGYTNAPHRGATDSGGAHSHSLDINSGGSHKHKVSVQEYGGAETRPRNVALLACIKY